MTNVQTIAKNVNASQDFTSESYRTEQRGSFSLDVNIINTVGRDFDITLEVSNNNSVWYKWLIIDEKVDRVCGASFTYNYLPYDYVRVVVTSGGSGLYDILLNER